MAKLFANSGDPDQMPHVSGQVKTVSPQCCGPPDELLPEAKGPQHFGADSFDWHPETYEIVVY